MLRFSAEVPFFIDFMSATTDPEFANECGLILASYLKNFRADVAPFDAVIGLKGGSPLVAYKLAERLQLPLLLYRGRSYPRRDSSPASPKELFDGERFRLTGRLLIVDDSTTGGRMVLDCAEQIRASGGTVVGLLVLFEVVGRNGRHELERNNIPFYAVTSMDGASVERLRQE